MDIICAKCGRHFSSIEAAREHRGHCIASNTNEEIHWLKARKNTNNKWVPSNQRKLTLSELERLKELEESLKNKSLSVKPDIKLSFDQQPLLEFNEKSLEDSNIKRSETDIIAKNPHNHTGRESDKKKPSSSKKRNTGNTPPGIFNNITWIANYGINNWVLSLFLIFVLSIIGFGIGILINDTTPFWLLTGFSIIFSVEYWLYYQTRKYIYIGRLYKLFLNLSLLYLLGYIIWFSIQLFSKQLTHTPIIGSILFVSEIIALIWLLRVVNSNKRRWPSIKLTTFSLICLFLIFAFAGVSPFNQYKDVAISEISNWYSSLRFENTTTRQGTDITESMIPAIPKDEDEFKDYASNSNNQFNLPFFNNDGEYNNYYFGLVKTPDGVLRGNDCYGEFIVLINNREAKNPTYSELLEFLESDKTDEFPYQYTLSILGFYYGEAEDKIDTGRLKNIIDSISIPELPKVCADFAERLHNNAEMAGIRCGYVSLDISGYTDPTNLGIASDSGHACNVFETTDKGLVYIDCTGDSYNYGPKSHDRIVYIEVGQEYNPHFLFDSGGWYIPSGQMGVVTDIFITWDGEWR